MNTNNKKLRIAIIGSGISGIATAHVLKKNGFEVVVFERSVKPGGVWATAYPDVHLQNIYTQYHLSDFPWPVKPDFHPSGIQIFAYLSLAIERLELDVRLQHEVVALTDNAQGWLVKYRNNGLDTEQQFDFAIISTGHYTQNKNHPLLDGEEDFAGNIITELDIKDLSVFNNKKTVVAGFGKTALDITTFATEHATEVHHVFRSPHWVVSEKVLGLHFTHLLFNRFGTVMMRSWAHPTAAERFLHRRLKFLVMGFWKMLTAVFRFQVKKHGRGKSKDAKERLKTILPKNNLIVDIGSRTALFPEKYLPMLAKGTIIPHHAALKGFTKEAIVLADGTSVPCDLVVLCLGFCSPKFRFLPQQYRDLLEKESDGTQLYRHLIHPRIPKLAFAGFNHGFMHVPMAEVGAQWIAAMLLGELQLPTAEAMEESCKKVSQWKKDNMNFEPARAYATSTRFQQYLDILLKDIGVSPYRKMPNIFAEIFSRYKATDYKNITEEYISVRKKTKKQLTPVNVNT